MVKSGRKTPPKKSKIFDYWKDRTVEQLELDIWFDWGEPSCWVCGIWWGSTYDVKSPDPSIKEIYECWNKVPLQRCHIVPRSLGGTNDPSNFFLMCPKCHND